MAHFQKNILFNIPIYRESEEDYYRRLKVNAEDRRNKIIKESVDKGLDFESVNLFYRDKPLQTNPDKIAWNYNRIIGWIDFYCDGIMIKTNLWFMRGNRISRNYSKIIIDYKSKLADVASTEYLSNKQIREAIKNFVRQLEKGEIIRLPSGCIIDSDMFLRLIKHLDIIRLLQSINSNSKKV